MRNFGGGGTHLVVDSVRRTISAIFRGIILISAKPGMCFGPDRPKWPGVNTREWRT